MRFRQFQLARIAGIPVMIDYRWVIVAALHVWLTSGFYLPRQVALPAWQYWVFGTLMTALLFASILAHELSHALVARLEGIQIHDIQLHIFGGWTRLANEPRTPLAELRVAIAGPVSSFLLGLLFLACLELAQWLIPDLPAYRPLRLPLREMLRYLFLSNLVLAMFNLMPGLPLDGGRVLRALLWHRRKDILAATQTAKRMGVALSYMLISYGFYRVVRWGDFLSAFWLVVVGFFLRNAAEQDLRYRERQHAVERAEQCEHAQWEVTGTVGAVMSAPAVSVPPELRISEFIDQVLSHHRHTSFPVARDGRLHGMILLDRLREVPQENWERLTVSEIMQPVDETLFIAVRASVEHAARKLKANQLGHLAVVDGDGMLVGYLSSSDVDRAA